MNQLKNMMQKAQQLQNRMMEVQKKLETQEVTGISGGGLVQIVFSGKGEAKSFSIDPSLLKIEEKDILEDLLVAASHDGKNKANALNEKEMAEITSGLPLPSGMKFPF